MKLFHYLASVSIIIFSVTFVVRSDTIKTARQIYPQKIIFTSTRDREIRACSMNVSNCDKWYFNPLTSDVQWPIQYVPYNNIIYSFLGFNGMLLVFDMYGNETKLIQRKFNTSDLSDPSNIQPVTAVHNGYIYTAIDSKLFKCSTNELEVCQEIMDDEKFRYLQLIKFHKQYIYMRYTDRTEQCSSFSHCYSMIGPTGAVGSAMDLAGEYVYVDGNARIHVIRCQTTSMECNRLNVDPIEKQSISGLYIFRKSIYFVTKTNCWKCNLTDLTSCESLTIDDRYFIITYSSVEMVSEYREEDKRCSWQPEDVCRNYVTYETDNSHLQLSVSLSGKLIDADGKLFDTSNASYIQFDSTSATNGMRAAIFVMDNGGSIFASNYHEPYKYHHSSLMAGKPVSSAGYLQVSNGVIKSVGSYSNHYQVPAEIAEQFLDSLYKQGYNASVVHMNHNSPFETSNAGHFYGKINTIFASCLVIFHWAYLAD